MDLAIHHKILTMRQASAPFVYFGQIIFSFMAPPNTQMVSLAFEHERYQNTYRYERNPNGVFILLLPIDMHVNILRYRLVVDGLWMADPNVREVRDDFGIHISEFALEEYIPQLVKGLQILVDGSIQFGFQGQSGSSVYLIGDFNNWDPFLTPMVESPIYPGYYYVVLDLPRNSKYYRYVIDGKEILDPYNFLISRNGWGESASILPER